MKRLHPWFGRSIAVIALASVPMTATYFASAGVDEFALVVHPSNPALAAGTPAQDMIRRMYLEAGGRWELGDVEGMPFRRPQMSDEQVAFRQQILGMTDVEVADHWAAVRKTRGFDPPRTIQSDDVLIRLVASHPGAFGVVKRSQAESAGGQVAILFTFGG